MDIGSLNAYTNAYGNNYKGGYNTHAEGRERNSTSGESAREQEAQAPSYTTEFNLDVEQTLSVSGSVEYSNSQQPADDTDAAQDKNPHRANENTANSYGPSGQADTRNRNAFSSSRMYGGAVVDTYA